VVDEQRDAFLVVRHGANITPYSGRVPTTDARKGAARMRLAGKRVIALVEEDYEDLELWYPVLRLQEEGAEVVVAGLGAEHYRGKHGLPAEPDKGVEELDMGDFDAILVVGGWAPDQLRRSEKVLELVRSADADGKLLGVICHGGWVPASAGVLKGRTMTCTPGIKDDVMNAGAEYVDRPVVVDGNLVTARRPPDLPAYGQALVEALAGQDPAG
jgi:protease I